MHDDPFPAAEKILADIESIFKRDKKLADFEILPVSVGENKSPVLHAEHTLGLEKWCIRHLYLHVYHRLMDLKQQQRLRREDPNTVSRLLLGGVLLNPDCLLMWNMRREFVVIGRFDPHTELHVAAVTLSRRPKTSEAFVYRRWIIDRIITKSSQTDATCISTLLPEEFRVSQVAADRYANNYHAWNHRMWVISHLAPRSSSFNDVLLDELETSEAWISRHVSEHSGLQYRQSILKLLMQHQGHSKLCIKLHAALNGFFAPLKNLENSAHTSKTTVPKSSLCMGLRLLVLEILENKCSHSGCVIFCGQSHLILHIGLLAHELLLVSELILLYPGHEALWSHRRFVLFLFNTLSKDISPQNEIPEVTDDVPVLKVQKLSTSEKHHEGEFLLRTVLWHENNLFEECTVGASEECYQNRLAQRHRKWFQQVLLPCCSSDICNETSSQLL